MCNDASRTHVDHHHFDRGFQLPCMLSRGFCQSQDAILFEMKYLKF